MKIKAEDSLGQRYGQLTILAISHRNARCNAFMLCQCDCGNKKVVQLGNLRNGHTVSCGCWNIKQSRDRNTTHGCHGTRLHGIWNGTLQRTSNPHRKSYKNYGERGITVCKEWHSFEAFQAWSLANGYSESLTIDRKDNGGNYEPDNCRWATMKEQERHRTNNALYEYDGKLRPLIEISEASGIEYKTLHLRLTRLGWGIERATSTPIRRISLRSRTT